MSPSRSANAFLTSVYFIVYLKKNKLVLDNLINSLKINNLKLNLPVLIKSR